jgi:hypothetical protein
MTVTGGLWSKETYQIAACGFQRKPPTFSDLKPPTVLT